MMIAVSLTMIFALATAHFIITTPRITEKENQ